MIRSLEYYIKEERGQISPEELSPILNPVSEPIKGKFAERYKLHQYWSRKPWYVVRQYIEHFTKEGDNLFVKWCHDLIRKWISYKSSVVRALKQRTNIKTQNAQP